MHLKNNFKELGEFSKQLQLAEYKRVYTIKELPEKDQKEIIILGKSNVGKSSLINTLINHSIAKTSKIPGCTRWLGYIKLRNITLIDVPGYGFASVSKGRKNFWQQMMEEYMESNRADLAIILVDSRKGIQEMDTEIASFVNDNALFVYTKYDKFSEKNLILPDNTIATSTKTGLGIHELRKLICEIN